MLGLMAHKPGTRRSPGWYRLRIPYRKMTMLHTVDRGPACRCRFVSPRTPSLVCRRNFLQATANALRATGAEKRVSFQGLPWCIAKPTFCWLRVFYSRGCLARCCLSGTVASLFWSPRVSLVKQLTNCRLTLHERVTQGRRSTELGCLLRLACADCCETQASRNSRCSAMQAE